MKKLFLGAVLIFFLASTADAGIIRLAAKGVKYTAKGAVKVVKVPAKAVAKVVW